MVATDTLASPRATADRRAVVIANPAARRAVPTETIRRAAVRALPGWDVQVAETRASADAPRLAAEAARAGVDAVVACGGDGTLNGVLNGLVESGNPRPVVGLIPAGTANVWAKEARIPRDPERALALLDTGVRVPLDLGVATIGDASRRFLLMCGVGLDAATVRRVEARPGLKRRLGPVAFGAQGLVAVARERPWPVRIEVDGVEVAVGLLTLAVAGNTRLYGGVARITAGARLDDGLLDLVTFEGAPGWRALPVALRQAGAALRGRLGRTDVRGVAYRRGGHVSIRPERALPVQVDGEWIGACDADAPLVLTVEPRAVTFALPAAPNPLFSLPATR